MHISVCFVSCCVLDADVLLHKSQMIHFQGFYDLAVRQIHYLKPQHINLQLNSLATDMINARTYI